MLQSLWDVTFIFSALTVQRRITFLSDFCYKLTLLPVFAILFALLPGYTKKIPPKHCLLFRLSALHHKEENIYFMWWFSNDRYLSGTYLEKLKDTLAEHTAEHLQLLNQLYLHCARSKLAPSIISDSWVTDSWIYWPAVEVFLCRFP